MRDDDPHFHAAEIVIGYEWTSRCVSSLVVNLNFQNVFCLLDCSRNRDSQIYTLGGELIVHVNVFKRRSSDKCQTGLVVLTVTMNQQSVDCLINSIKSAARSLGLIPRDGYTRRRCLPIYQHYFSAFQANWFELSALLISNVTGSCFLTTLKVHSAVGIFIFPCISWKRETSASYISSLIDYLERNIARKATEKEPAKFQFISDTRMIEREKLTAAF